MTKKEQARYRAICRQLARMTAKGWDRTTHPDFEPLEAELQTLGNKLIGEPEAMTPYEAWLFAATWGSYIRSGDPGACMYGFNEKFAVQSEDHRQACLAWVRDECEPQVKAHPEDYDADELDKLAQFRQALINAPVAA